MRSWTSSRTNKPASKPQEEVVEAVREEEVITVDVATVEVEEAVVAVVEVDAVVVVVEEAFPRAQKEKQTAQARPHRHINDGLAA